MAEKRMIKVTGTNGKEFILNLDHVWKVSPYSEGTLTVRSTASPSSSIHIKGTLDGFLAKISGMEE